jgi:hypothetical protein
MVMLTAPDILHNQSSSSSSSSSGGGSLVNVAAAAAVPEAAACYATPFEGAEGLRNLAEELLLETATQKATPAVKAAPAR